MDVGQSEVGHIIDVFGDGQYLESHYGFFHKNTSKSELENKAVRRTLRVYAPRLHKRLEIFHRPLTRPDVTNKTNVLWGQPERFFFILSVDSLKKYKSVS